MENNPMIYDLTITIRNEMAVWPGDPQVHLERIHKIEEGSNSNVSKMDLSVHTGTHMDAPVHFIPGAKSIDTLPLDVLIGPAQVVQLLDTVSLITSVEVDAAGIQPGVTRVLFKTRNSKIWQAENPPFNTSFVAVSADGAQALVNLGIRLVGIDYLSIAPYKQSKQPHQILLGAGIVIAEGLNLSQVKPGMYTLICLPLKLSGSDGSPARAVLVDGPLV
jgi:arylformamidase